MAKARKNKLSNMEKEDFKAIMPAFLEMGGALFAFPDHKVSIAIRPACKAKNPNFFKVSASYCAQQDKFNVKRGAFEALLKNMNEEFMLIPSQGFSAAETAEILADFLQ